MKDTATTFAYDLTDLGRPMWQKTIEDTAEDHGSFEPIGMTHSGLFIDAGRTLLVSFETVATIRRTAPDNAPLGWGFVKSHGWSSLTLMAQTAEDWFRHPAIFGYFDRLIDDGFFDDFDQVLFYGAGSCGYAAAAYSVACPDAQVLVIQPQATLDVARAPWDRRFPQTRMSDFKSRFGYAPMMVETAEEVFVVHDPSVIEDAMHASLFDGANTTHLTCPFVGPDAENALLAMNILPELIEQAMDGMLDTVSYAQLWRARRSHMPYLRTLLHRIEAGEEHPRLLARLCRHVNAKGNRPMFAKKLAELEAQGVRL